MTGQYPSMCVNISILLNEHNPHPQPSSSTQHSSNTDSSRHDLSPHPRKPRSLSKPTDVFSRPVVTILWRQATEIHLQLWPWLATMCWNEVGVMPYVYSFILLIFSHSRGRCTATNQWFLGHSLAYCQIFLTLAGLFAPHRFKLELFETDISDVEVKHDYIGSVCRLDSKGIRLTVN